MFLFDRIYDFNANRKLSCSLYFSVANVWHFKKLLLPLHKIITCVRNVSFRFILSIVSKPVPSTSTNS